ncbi:MAG: DUF1292 domain-containing protein [Candidatus Coproplasma sp.]
MNLLDMLLDENEALPITLTNADGKEITFEQVAVIPLGDELYCILKPIDELEDVNDDEAIVFLVDQSGEEPTLKLEEDEEIAEAVFGEYVKLWEEENN